MPTRMSSEEPPTIPPDFQEQDDLRDLNRTPHPYHHQSPELPYASDRFLLRPDTARQQQQSPQNGQAQQSGIRSRLAAYAKDSSPASESGTEADDEHFLKGLPAPKVKLHKGLRGQEDEHLSGTSTPLLSSAAWEQDAIVEHAEAPKPTLKRAAERRRVVETLRRNKNLAQRAVEGVIVTALGLMVRANPQVSVLLGEWERGSSHPCLGGLARGFQC